MTVKAEQLTAEFFDALARLGLPPRITNLKIELEQGKPVKITCTFEPEAPDMQKPVGAATAVLLAIETQTKHFRLVEIDPKD